jgi:hypothetical protein
MDQVLNLEGHRSPESQEMTQLQGHALADYAPLCRILVILKIHRRNQMGSRASRMEFRGQWCRSSAEIKECEESTVTIIRGKKQIIHDGEEQSPLSDDSYKEIALGQTGFSP